MMDSPATTVNNIARAQLRIQHVAVTRDSQRVLLHAAGKIPIQQYYSKKYGWTTTIFDSISWMSQKKVLDHFDFQDQTRILKFVHGWLPTQSRLLKEGSSFSPRCKLCTELYGNNFHMLRCQHPAMQTIQEDTTTFLLRQLSDHGNSELINILQIAIEGSRYNSNWQPSLQDLSPEWRRAIMEQNRIGWKHIFYGRISTCMITAMEDHYHTLNINTKQYSGERWAKKFIINIWTTILKLWKTRNDIIYDSENKQHLESLRDKLKSRVLRCYALQDQLLANDHCLWFDTALQDKLEEDPKQIQTWLSLVERIIRISKREQNK
jgi:hypothetical protein